MVEAFSAPLCSHRGRHRPPSFHVGLAGLGLDGQQEVVGGLHAGIVGAGGQADNLTASVTVIGKTPFVSALGLVIFEPQLHLASYSCQRWP